MRSTVQTETEKSAGTASRPLVVTEEVLAALPAAVQRYLRFAGVVGRPVPSGARLRQRGAMRMKPGGRWLPILAVQSFSFDRPGFSWRARMKLLPFYSIRAEDSFADGRGRMQVWAAPFVKVVDARGPEMNQGELQRYLSEIGWFPAALAHPSLRWEATDEDGARLSLAAGETTATVEYRMVPDGRVLQVVADRYRAGDHTGRLTRWSGVTVEYAEAGGLHLPLRAQAIWRLPAGPFVYFRGHISDIELDQPSAD
jgi:hypothetical protein